MTDEHEFEMLVNVMQAKLSIRNAESFVTHDLVMSGWLADAKSALQRVIDDCSEENQRKANEWVNR